MGKFRLKVAPHDLFKLIDWSKHCNRELIDKKLPDDVKGKYKIPCKRVDGKEELRSLEQVIERHHSSKSFWSRLWSYADSLSTIVARFRFMYDYWYLRGGDPFFVKVYGDLKEWSVEDRKRLFNRVIEVLVRYADEEVEHSSALETVNDLLAEFPADSRFPFTSLKTHHWLTQAIYNDGTFWAKMSQATLEKGGVYFDVLYLIRATIAEPEFHRLRELRGFVELRSKIMAVAKERLSDRLPLQVGDDLYLICLSKAGLQEIVETLTGTGFGFDLDVYEWRIGREKRAVRPDGSEETIRRVETSNLNRYSIGVHEEFEYSPENVAEYTEILEGGYDYVAWVCLKPEGDMESIARSFLEWGERELERRYGGTRVKLKEPFKEPAENFLSPELALSIAEGYGEFLTDCEKTLIEEGFEAATAFKSFGRAVFISGIGDLPDAYRIYTMLAERKANLHIPSTLIVAETKPKYPFWHILELFDSVNTDSLIFIVGEKMVKLSDEDVLLLREVVPELGNVSRSQFGDIITASRRAGLEELKLIIEGKSADGKIPWRASKKICELIDKLSKRYGEENLRKVLWRCFKMLEPFTRREKRR